MSYNMSCWESVVGFNGLLDCGFLMQNQAGETHYILGYIVIFVMYIILFSMMKLRTDLLTAIIASSWITLLIAILMGFMGWINWIIIMIPLLMLIGSILFKLFGDSNGGYS